MECVLIHQRLFVWINCSYELSVVHCTFWYKFYYLTLCNIISVQSTMHLSSRQLEFITHIIFSNFQRHNFNHSSLIRSCSPTSPGLFCTVFSLFSRNNLEKILCTTTSHTYKILSFINHNLEIKFMILINISTNWKNNFGKNIVLI